MQDTVTVLPSLVVFTARALLCFGPWRPLFWFHGALCSGLWLYGMTSASVGEVLKRTLVLLLALAWYCDGGCLFVIAGMFVVVHLGQQSFISRFLYSQSTRVCSDHFSADLPPVCLTMCARHHDV